MRARRLKTLVPLWAKHAARRVAGRPPSSARRYLRPGLSVEEFLGRLTDGGARYAVLRWFETLPTVEPDNDIDMLIADEDLPLAESLLTPYRPFRETQKVDLYSAGGLPRTTFGGVPYFSSRLAGRLLDGAVLLHGRYRVPSVEDHFDSLAFHAVYHKGHASGLPTGEPSSRPDHGGRIGATLSRLAGELSRDVELSLDGLGRYLHAQGLEPAPETLEPFAAERRRLYGS